MGMKVLIELFFALKKDSSTKLEDTMYHISKGSV